MPRATPAPSMQISPRNPFDTGRPVSSRRTMRQLAWEKNGDPIFASCAACSQGMRQTIGALLMLPIGQPSTVAFNGYIAGAAVRCGFKEFVEQFIPDEI
jgi:hypothetical protein